MAGKCGAGSADQAGELTIQVGRVLIDITELRGIQTRSLQEGT